MYKRQIYDRGFAGGADDWFNQNFHLGSGAQVVTVPLERVRQGPRHRLMDMRAIREVVIYAVGLPRPQRISLSPIRLESRDRDRQD